MYIYEFEKGEIRTGIAIDLETDDQKMFEDNYGRFVKVYNDGKHTDEQLEFVYAFVEVLDDEDVERRLILTKDKDEIALMETDDKYELACMDEVECMEGIKPINFVCLDGFVSLTIEEYISNDKKVNRSNYISVSWI